MPESLQSLIARGEGIDIEFKTCRNQLNKNVYETVCAFLNRHGGTLLLDIKDDGTVQGIAPDAIEQIRKDYGLSTEITIKRPAGRDLDLVKFNKYPGALRLIIKKACPPERTCLFYLKHIG